MMTYVRKTRPAPWTMTKPQPKKQPRQRIPASTKQRAKELRQYRERVKVWIAGKVCAVYPDRSATECHHKKGRVGRLLLDESNWIPVSKEAHEKIHHNPEWARQSGYLAERGEWNNQKQAKTASMGEGS